VISITLKSSKIHKLITYSFNHYEANAVGLRPSGTMVAHVGRNSIFLKVVLALAIEPSIKLDVHIEYAK